MSASYGDPDIFTLLGAMWRYHKFSRESNRRLRQLIPERAASLADIQSEYAERLERILRHALQDEAAAVEPVHTNLRMADVIQLRRSRRH